MSQTGSPMIRTCPEYIRYIQGHYLINGYHQESPGLNIAAGNALPVNRTEGEHSPIQI